MPRFSALLAALALAAAPAALRAQAATDLVQFRVFTADDGTIFALDSASIVNHGQSRFGVQTWVLFADTVHLSTGEVVDREVDVEELDCAGGRIRGLGSSASARGQVVKTVILARTWTAVSDARRPIFDASCQFLLGSFAASLPVQPSEADEHRPELLDAPEVEAAISRAYPTPLKDAGVGGTVTLRFRVMEDGSVDRGSIQIVTSSDPRFGTAAWLVVGSMRFQPARVDGKAVPVWVTQPVTFATSNAAR